MAGETYSTVASGPTRAMTSKLCSMRALNRSSWPRSNEPEFGPSTAIEICAHGVGLFR